MKISENLRNTEHHKVKK